MSTAGHIWRGENESKRKIVRSLWPALADALDGAARSADSEPPPMCATCETRQARGTCDGKPICGMCVGRLDPAARHDVRR